MIIAAASAKKMVFIPPWLAKRYLVFIEEIL
jgi:hypothetical protein